MYSKELSDKKLLIIGLYVDDLVIASDTEAGGLREIKEALSNRFEMSELGKLHHVLRIEVQCKGVYTYMHQDRYTEKILQKFG